ncbi:unnamed protein product [Caenorhabditis brenneri]
MDLDYIFQYLFTKSGESTKINLPMSFEQFEILDIAAKREIIIDKTVFWGFEEKQNGKTFITVPGEAEKECVVDFSKNDSFGKVVRFYLNRQGTAVESLVIFNHPYGLESCAPLRIKNLKWTLEINSPRYDYTTWFNCLRTYQIESVELDLNGEDYTILSEDVISNASKLHVQTMNPLPIQAILNLKARDLKLEQKLNYEDFLRICEQWNQLRKPIGSKITVKIDDFESLKTKLKLNFEDHLEENQEWCIIAISEVKLNISYSNSSEIMIEVIE